MRSYLFLIPILFAIIILTSQNSFASTTTRYDTYNVTDVGNGTHILLAGLPPRLADGAGHFQKDFYFYNNTNTYTIATGFGTYVYNVNTCGLKFFEPVQNTTGHVPTINAVSLTLKNSIHPFSFKIVNFTNSCSTNVFNNGTYLQINGSKINTQAKFSVIYTLKGGTAMKTSYAAKVNVTGFYWDITEAQDNIPNKIFLGNGTILDVNPTTFPNNVTRIFPPSSLQSGNSARISYLDSFGKLITYDYQTSINSLFRIGIALNQTNNDIGMFNDFHTSNALNTNDTFTVDPTFGYASGSSNWYTLSSTPQNAANCVTTLSSNSTVHTTSLDMFGKNWAASTACNIFAMRWNISSLPSTAVVTDAKIQFSVGTFVNIYNCDYRPILANDPILTISPQSVVNEIVSAIPYISNDANCANSGLPNTKTVDLGTQATIDATHQIGNGWFGLGFTYTGFPVRPVTNTQYDVTFSNNQLQLTYNTPQKITIRALQSDGSTALFPANVIDKNSTKSGILPTNSTGHTGIFLVAAGTLQNFTTKDMTSNFVVNKTYNYSPLSNTTITVKTNVFKIDCPSNGAGNDILLETNGTDGHRITVFSTPTCSSNNTISWNVTWKGNANLASSYSSSVYAKVLTPASFGVDPGYITVNGTHVTTSFNIGTNTITSNSFNVGTGLQTINKQFTMRLISPSQATAPLSLRANPSGDDKITLTWLKPISNGTSPIFGFKILRNSTTLINNTGNLNLSFQNTGIAANHLQTYQLCAWNVAGCGAFSNQASNFTYIGTTGNVFLNYTIVGDVVGLTPQVVITNGNPQVNVYKINLFNKTNQIGTEIVNRNMILGSSVFFPTFYNQLLNNQNYTFQAIVTNATNGNITKTSNATGLIVPAFIPTPSTLNYTLHRPTPFDQLSLTVNREPITFKIECNYKTGIFDKGLWHNFTGVGYYKQIDSVSGATTYYISCYNDQLLFSIVSYGNFNGTTLINNFSGSFGFLFGVPIIMLFLIFLAAIGTGRSASTIFIMWGIALGIMDFLQFFPAPIAPWVWGAVVLFIALGIFRSKQIT